MLAEHIIGNEDVKEYLETMIKKGNVLHSYLFLGKSGIGKKEIAKAFSKLILCETKEENCTCKSCVCFDSDNHPDFELIDCGDESSIKIKKIRELNEKVYEKPIISNKKVYIIDEAEKMTKEAQNALLKTLEEPPEFVTIILISSNENLLLNTIKSRCIKVTFNNIKDDDIKDYISNNLKYSSLSNNLLKYIDGSIGKAIELEGKEEHYNEIDKLLLMVNSLDIIDFLRLGKIIYDKDNIYNYLEYMIVCLYSYSKKNKRYIYTIEHINNCIKMLKSNTNFDMCIDNMLIKIWEEINESSNRS